MLFASLFGPASTGAISSSPQSQVLAELPARPAPILERRETPEVRDLEAATAARWEIAWDPWTGVAARGVVVQGTRVGTTPPAGRVAVQRSADGFRSRHARMLGADAVELEPLRLVHAGGGWHVTWQQKAGARRVLGCLLDLVLDDAGQVVVFRSTLAPGMSAPAPRWDRDAALGAAASRLGLRPELESSAEVIAVVPGATGSTAVPAFELVLRLPTGWRGRALVDATSGEVLECQSLVLNSAIDGTSRALVKPLYAQDPDTEVPLSWLGIQVGFGENANVAQTNSDGEGHFGFDHLDGTVTVRAGLTGLYASVDNAACLRRAANGSCEKREPSPHIERQVTAPGVVTLVFGAVESRPDERTIYYHINRAHDHLRSRFGFALLDFPVQAVAESPDPGSGDPNYPNAYWNGERMGFGNGGRTFYNMGLYADVIYHEYGHAVTDYIYRPAGALSGTIGNAMHEALADYLAAEMNGEPRIGDFLLRSTTAPFRNLDNQLFWPDDRDDRDEPHANGMILAGALWDVRQTAGPEVADPVIHFARYLFPRTFEEFLDAMLVEDDMLFGDGWPGNGSPHRDAILTGFAWHGIGPFATRRLQIVHAPLRDTEDVASPRIVRVRLASFLRECSGYARLSYRTDGEFTDVWLDPQPDGSLATTLPPMREGTRVEYYLAGARVHPVLVSYLPAEAPQKLFSYRVGPDTQPPQIEHAPRTAYAAFAWPADLVAHIDDNLGVAYAFVEYTQNGEPRPRLGMAPSADDPSRYWTRFAAVGGQPGEVIEYSITAVDLSRAGNRTRLPETGTFRVELVPDLADGFESGEPAWEHRPLASLYPDPWHVTASFNHTPGGQKAWWCGVEAGEYPPGTAAALVTDSYRIGSGATASLWCRIDAETDAEGGARDGGRVEIQAEGESTWQVLTPAGGYSHVIAADAGTGALASGTPCLSGRDSDWRRLEFDLGEWARHRVRLRFLFGSDPVTSQVGHLGWIVDDFSLQPGVPDPTDAVAAPGPRRIGVQVSPNPFNPRVTFRLAIPAEAGQTTLDLLDSRGRLVRRLLAGASASDPRQLDLVWDGTDSRGLASASGVYYYRLESALGVEAGKLVLLR
jgi:hypothetical protein